MQTVLQLSDFPNLCIPVYLLGVFNIKAEKTFVFMLRSHVMCWGLNDFLRKQAYCVCVKERDWDFAICTNFQCFRSIFNIHIQSRLILGTFKLMIHFRALWYTTLYALRNKTHQSPKILMPGQASEARRPVKVSTARLIGGDNEIPTLRMAQSQTQLKDWVCPQ